MEDIIRPETLPSHLARALHHLDIQTWSAAAGISPMVLLCFKHVGRRGLQRFESEMASRGIAYTPKTWRPELASLRPPWGMAPQPLEPTCGVYFMACENYIKIGCAGSVFKRLRDIQLCNPFPVRLLAVDATDSIAQARELERTLHKRFAMARAQREWFHDCSEIREYVGHLITREANKTP